MYFCLDMGGSKTRGALISNQGETLAQATETGGALSLGADNSTAVIRQIWQTFIDDPHVATPPEEQIGIVAGIAGATIPGEAGKLSENLSEFSSIKIVSDGYAALIGATGGKPGTLISIGTGTTGMRLMADGGSHALSGWGFPIGDQGSGAWLGLQTTQLLTQHIDGIYLAHPMSTEFFDKVILSLGGDRQSILDWQKNALPKDYASLARLIVEYAQRNDPHCVFLMEQAAGDIIGLAQTLLNLDSDKANETGQNGPLWLAGGLSGPMLPYLKALEPNCHWQLSTADALAGLYLLASGNAPAERTILRNSATVL